MEFNSGKVQDLINSIGALAEIGSYMRDELIRQHFTREEAVTIVSNVLCSILTSSGKK